MDENNLNNDLENVNNKNAQDLNVEPTNTENPYYNPYFQENGGDNNQNVEQTQGLNQILAGGLEQPQAETNTNNTVNPFDLGNNEGVNSEVNNNYQDNNMQSNFDMNYQDPNQSNFDMNYQDPNQNNFNMNYQDPNQNNFDMNYQNQAQNNFDMNYQNPGQNNFDMNYQNQVQDNMNYQNTIPNNQTQPQSNNSKKKTGKSVPIILIVIILLVIVGAIVAAIIFLPKMLSKEPKPQNNNLGDNNVVNEPTTNVTYHKFYGDYAFDYDASKWGTDSENKVLTSGTYKLTFAQALENLSSVGYDAKMPTDRASFFTFLYNQFSAQADVATTAVELGTSNFTLKNNNYYAYLDLVYGTSIERCYFILLPEDDIFIEFILSNEDTVISDEMNEEVLNYMCDIYKQNETNNPFEGFTPIGNEVTNDIGVENTIINETITNGIENNVVTNEVTDTNTSIGGATGGIVLTRP